MHLHSTLQDVRNFPDSCSKKGENLSNKTVPADLKIDPSPTENMPNSNVSENKDSIDSILSNIITSIKKRSTRWKIVQNLEKVTLLENIRKNLEKYNNENPSHKITNINSVPQALEELIRGVCAEHRNLKIFSPEETKSTQELEAAFGSNRGSKKSFDKKKLLKAANDYDQLKTILDQKPAKDGNQDKEGPSLL